MKKNKKSFLSAVNKMGLLILAFLILLVAIFSCYRLYLTKAYPLKYKEEICYYADYYNCAEHNNYNCYI